MAAGARLGRTIRSAPRPVAACRPWWPRCPPPGLPEASRRLLVPYGFFSPRRSTAASNSSNCRAQACAETPRSQPATLPTLAEATRSEPRSPGGESCPKADHLREEAAPCTKSVTAAISETETPIPTPTNEEVAKTPPKAFFATARRLIPAKLAAPLDVMWVGLGGGSGGPAPA
jgi:hypothetical protein